MANHAPEAPAPLAAAPRPPSRPRPFWIKGLKWLVIASVIGVVAYAVLIRPLARPAEKGRANAGNRTVPVTAEAARKSDLSVRIFALGTVTSVNTTVVRSRVDGQLQKIFFEEGRSVEAGAPLAEIDPRPFEAQKQQAEAQLAKDNSSLENARLDLDRFEKLLAQDSVPKQQVDTQRALVRQLEAAVRVAQAQADTAALQVNYAHITAPTSGRVGLRLVDLGNMIHASDTGGIVVITQLHPISVLFSITQDALPAVLKRFKANDPIAVEAFDRDGKTLLASGKLVTIDNQIDPSTGTVKLRAEFPNEDELLFPNQFVNVQLIAEKIEDATVVPAAAVQRGAAGTFVYVVKEEKEQKTVSVRPIKTGTDDRGLTAVVEGVAPGDLVVVDGVDKLREGSPVEVVSRAAAGSPEGKKGKGGKSGGKRAREGAKPAPN
jgi:multidrug efflux system membrane fusion protein